MNKAFGWILHQGWAAVLVSLVALPAHAQLMIGHMGHGGDCSIKTGAFPVSFNAYKTSRERQKHASHHDTPLKLGSNYYHPA